MAKYRYIYCEFWKDPDTLEYTPEDKFFYLYLLSNPYTKQCGVYEISIKQMAFETGFNRDTIKKLIERFQDNYKKIKYNTDTREMCIINWAKYNLQNSGQPILDCLKKELKEVKDKDLLKLVLEKIDKKAIQALYINQLDGAYTGGGTSGTQKEKEKEKEKENQKEESEEDFLKRKKQDNGFYSYPEDFEKLWDIYPRKINKKIAWQKWKNRIKDGIDNSLLLKATKTYAEDCRLQDTQERYMTYPQTFWGSGGYWQEYLERDKNKENNIRKKQDEQAKQKILEKQLNM